MHRRPNKRITESLCQNYLACCREAGMRECHKMLINIGFNLTFVHLLKVCSFFVLIQKTNQSRYLSGQGFIHFLTLRKHKNPKLKKLAVT